MKSFGLAVSSRRYALRLLLVPLAAIVLGELAIMALVDRLLHAGAPYWLAALLDAAVLTLVCVPPLWLFVIRPMQRAYAAAAETAQASVQALMDAAAETALLAAADGRLLAINQAGALRFKMTPATLLGRNLYDCMQVDTARHFKARIDAVLASGVPDHFEDRQDGRCYATSVYPVVNEHGTALRFAVLADDITERLQLQGIDALLNDCDQRVLRGEHAQELLRFICNEVVRLFDLHLAWVGRKEPDGQVSIAACGGECACSESMRRAGARWDDAAEGRGPIGAVIRSGQAQVFRAGDSGFRSWWEAAEQTGIRAVIVIPLITRGQIYGTFTLYSTRADRFDAQGTVKHLTEIAGRISVLVEMAIDQQQLRLLSTAVTTAGNGVFICDRSGRIEWVNPAFTRLCGYGAEELIGQNPRLLKSGRQDGEYYRQLWHTILNGGVWCRETIERHKDGRLYTVMQTVTPIRDATGEISHFVSILEDITARKQAEERVRHMAHYDALTNLPNRALFYDRLHQALVLAKREGRQAALMFIDLDRFKAVNDEFGHAVGDRLLQAVSERMRACVREADTLARLAGDEFTVILPHVEHAGDAQVVAEKMLAALALPFELEQHAVQSGASIGIALYPQDATDADGLVKCADNAMYAAKAQGRNQWRFCATAAPAAGQSVA